MEREIEEISKKLKKESSSLKEKAKGLRREKDLFKPIKPRRVSESISAVDGGLITKELHGVNLVITRACAVNMDYEKGRLKDYSYYPGPSPEPKLKSFSPQRASKKPSLHRVEEEIGTAISHLNNSNEGQINLLLLDGSIIPSPNDKPPEGSEEREHYFKIIGMYQEMFSTASEKDIQIVGVIEDSNSRKISKRNGVDQLDSILLSHLLEEGERTKEFNYSDEPGNHPVLSDFSEEWRNKVKAVYIKPCEQDIPLRLEYLDTGRDVDDIAAVISELSKVSKDYSYPAPLIEADLHAKLGERETGLILGRIKSYTGEDVLLREKRRNKRPFK